LLLLRASPGIGPGENEKARAGVNPGRPWWGMSYPQATETDTLRWLIMERDIFANVVYLY
jgi:hypothetical protein